jgi:hypothetical protein
MGPAGRRGLRQSCGCEKREYRHVIPFCLHITETRRPVGSTDYRAAVAAQSDIAIGVITRGARSAHDILVMLGAITSPMIAVVSDLRRDTPYG